MVDEGNIIEACWPAPGRVRAVVSTRRGGYSTGPWESFNLGMHVGDDANAVRANRELLCRVLGLAAQPQWLRQVHGTIQEATGQVIATGDPAIENQVRVRDLRWPKAPGTSMG